MITDPRDPAFIEPAYVVCKACDGQGFIEDGDGEENEETCFDCLGEGVFEL